MKCLLDQGLPRSAAGILSDRGVEALHLASLGLSSSPDKTILEVARAGDYVVVTLDADFHALIALSGSTSPSVIRIRIEGLKAPELARLLEQILTDHGPALTKGAIITVGQSRTAVRHLPITPRGGN